MTPDEVEALDDEVYVAFCRHMREEAAEVRRQQARSRR
jgi:hypothetical protein